MHLDLKEAFNKAQALSLAPHHSFSRTAGETAESTPFLVDRVQEQQCSMKQFNTNYCVKQPACTIFDSWTSRRKSRSSRGLLIVKTQTSRSGQCDLVNPQGYAGKLVVILSYYWLSASALRWCVVATVRVYVLLETTLGCLTGFSFCPVSLLHSSQVTPKSLPHTFMGPLSLLYNS